MVATCVGFGGQLPTSQTAKRDGGEWLCCFKRAQARTRVQRETSVVNRSSCYELIFSVWVFSRLFLSHGQVSILNVCVRVCVCVFIHLCFFVRWSCSGIVGSIMLSLMWRRTQKWLQNAREKYRLINLFLFIPKLFFSLYPYLFFLHLLVASLQSQKMADENSFIVSLGLWCFQRKHVH